MKQAIIDLITQHGCHYVELDTENDLKIVHDCLINKYIDDKDAVNQNGTVLLYYGFYYRYIEINPELMKKYYMIGIEKTNIYCMYNYGNWYDEKNDIENTEKYYKMAIKHGASARLFASWYGRRKDYDNMIKYYSIGAKNGNRDCINEMNEYFQQSLDVKRMCSVYMFLTNANKEKLNEIIMDVRRIDNINVINETVCICCERVTMCIFLICSHSVCEKCYGNTCNICK
jgi:tetratricopeptide (TPR) repeat protein